MVFAGLQKESSSRMLSTISASMALIMHGIMVNLVIYVIHRAEDTTGLELHHWLHSTGGVDDDDGKDSFPWRKYGKSFFFSTLFEIFIFCPKIQLCFPEKIVVFFWGEKLAKLLWYWAF